MANLFRTQALDAACLRKRHVQNIMVSAFPCATGFTALQDGVTGLLETASRDDGLCRNDPFRAIGEHLYRALAIGGAGNRFIGRVKWWRVRHEFVLGQ